MDTKRRAQLRKEGQSLDVTLEIGKAGLTPTVAKELKKQLDTHKLVKVSIRKSASTEDDTRTIAAQLADQAGAQLVEVRGKTAVYAKGASRSD